MQHHAMQHAGGCPCPHDPHPGVRTDACTHAASAAAAKQGPTSPMDFMMQRGKYKTLLTAINAAGLGLALGPDFQGTLFLPNDKVRVPTYAGGRQASTSAPYAPYTPQSSVPAAYK